MKNNETLTLTFTDNDSNEPLISLRSLELERVQIKNSQVKFIKVSNLELTSSDLQQNNAIKDAWLDVEKAMEVKRWFGLYNVISGSLIYEEIDKPISIWDFNIDIYFGKFTATIIERKEIRNGKLVSGLRGPASAVGNKK